MTFPHSARSAGRHSASTSRNARLARTSQRIFAPSAIDSSSIGSGIGPLPNHNSASQVMKQSVIAAVSVLATMLLGACVNGTLSNPTGDPGNPSEQPHEAQPTPSPSEPSTPKSDPKPINPVPDQPVVQGDLSYGKPCLASRALSSALTSNTKATSTCAASRRGLK